jgi:hypothetical protein
MVAVGQAQGLGNVILQWILKWVGGDLATALTRAYELKLNAANDADRIKADVSIKAIEAQMAAQAASAAVVREGMQHKAFWVPWLIAAVPCAGWFGWGMMDSAFGGSLPDVAALPPQLKEYADIVFANIFYVGGGVAGAQLIAKAIGGRK